MKWKDIVPILAGGLVVLVIALVVKPALLTEIIDGPELEEPFYIPPTPVPTATPFPDDAQTYTRNFRWTSINGGGHITEVRVPKALFVKHRETSRFDMLAWGLYALDEGDRPIIEDLAHRIAPPHKQSRERIFQADGFNLFRPTDPLC